MCVYIDNICKDVECGKGSCEKAPGKPFNFICKCEGGWKRTHHDDDDDEDDLKFLPCIVPKCSVDYSCLPAPPPAPPIPHNMSFFDRAIGADCQRKGIRLSNSTASSPSSSTPPSIFNTNSGGNDNNEDYPITTYSPIHLYEESIKKDRFGIERRREGHETSESTMALCRTLLLNIVRKPKSKLQHHFNLYSGAPKEHKVHKDKPQTKQSTKSQRGAYIIAALLLNL
ncbi:putative ribose-5-phosphate isomerase-like [Capsicum annuum]|nr:putative ribose-5-phosphate isomerase-like [Capsicum annuum]